MPLWPIGATLCDECELLDMFEDEDDLAAPLAPGAALQAALAAPGTVPVVYPSGPPAFADPQAPAQPTGPSASREAVTVPPFLPAPLSASELMSAPTASFAIRTGGSAEVGGAPLRSSDGQAAASAGPAQTPQPPSASPPQPLAPALPTTVPPAFLPFLQQALTPTTPVPPHMLIPPAARLISEAAAAHASVVEAQAAEELLREAWAATLSLPVVNPAMIAQLHQLAMPHMPFHTQLVTSQGAAAIMAAARRHRQGQQYRREHEALAHAATEAGYETAARMPH